MDTKAQSVHARHTVPPERPVDAPAAQAAALCVLLPRETVRLGVLDGCEVLHVDKVDWPARVGIASKVGSRAVAHTTGLGKALLAAGPDEAVEDSLAHATSPAAPLLTADPETFRAEIRLIRERGYSI